jgi:hypothetical protein
VGCAAQNINPRAFVVQLALASAFLMATSERERERQRFRVTTSLSNLDLQRAAISVSRLPSEKRGADEVQRPPDNQISGAQL